MSTLLSPQITTPMALAALALLLAAPIVHRVLKRKGRPNRDTQVALIGMLGLGLVFGVLAFASYMSELDGKKEVRVAGFVMDENGKGIQDARVTIPGRAEAITNDRGGFEIAVPASRATDVYDIKVFKDGYEAGSVQTKGSSPTPVTMELKLADVELGKALRLPSSMQVRHNLGVPSIEVALTYSNSQPSDIEFTDIGVTLVSPAGEEIPMMMEGISLTPGRFDPPTSQWVQKAKTYTTVTHYFFNIDGQFMALQHRVFAELAPKAATVTQPDPHAQLLSAEIVDDLRAYMNSRFIWVPGTWTIKAQARVKGEKITSEAKFDLPESSVKRMRAVADYYPSAIGVAPNWRFVGTGESSPVLNVALRSASS